MCCDVKDGAHGTERWLSKQQATIINSFASVQGSRLPSSTGHKYAVSWSQAKLAGRCIYRESPVAHIGEFHSACIFGINVYLDSSNILANDGID